MVISPGCSDLELVILADAKTLLAMGPAQCPTIHSINTVHGPTNIVSSSHWVILNGVPARHKALLPAVKLCHLLLTQFPAEHVSILLLPVLLD